MKYITRWWYEFIASIGGIYLLTLGWRAYEAMKMGEKYACGTALFFVVWAVFVYITLFLRIKCKLKCKSHMQECSRREALRLKELKDMIEEAKKEGDWS